MVKKTNSVSNMDSLFMFGHELQNESLVQNDSERFFNLELSETMGELPFKISIHYGNRQMTHGKQTKSFKTLQEAQNEFNELMNEQLEKGFQKKIA
ncbi:WGR domain-containing protein (plasmid) [Aneurinibacillus sp. Ricciae_BoGa-3]|uniref:WGR domain-containing protein n=1 Tax=Aneurinibacillus sp. Ricciae_BoGa-3 TaxID=3022697 RepID=UPI002340C75D|nr:WGR domain-containing protein [Aneurinibacillus sp. Ricciae_BoGa-3]WCK57308.1 WGR domain-containing protein [Aneurinibacillus sp. Ricciae_BoGa-3]